MRQPADNTLIRRFLDAVVAGVPSPQPVEAWAEMLEEDMHLTTFHEGQVLVERHVKAEVVHFLVTGTLRYEHLVSDPEQGETVSDEQAPWKPLGWTGLHFSRYRVTIHADSDGELLTLPLQTWRRLKVDAPTLWACLSEFIFRASASMLWKARGRQPQRDSTRPAVRPGVTAAPQQAPETLHDLYQSSPCFSPLPVECRRWLAEHTLMYDADEGTRVLQEGEIVDGLWLLQLGRVALRFTLAREGDDGSDEQAALRYVVRSGTLLCWSTLDTPVPAPYTVETTRRSRFAVVPREALTKLLEHRPEWVAAIFQQQQWQLRTYLTSTRVEVGERPADGGIAALEDLIRDSMPLLPVNTLLYGVPYLLRNYLTRREGFERLYRTHFHGTESERIVATLALDLLRDLERGHRFFEGMQATYDAVTHATHLPPEDLRKLSTQYFRKALSHVPYAIKGWENLPDDPNCIFIYNHMAYAPDSILPNGFLFNPDSHFLSGVVMEPKFGDGLRVARANDAAEFWRADYYDRQGHLSVVTKESGWREETQEQKRARKEQFLTDCKAVLASGRPFSIAPEGTITEEDSTTEHSPGPLRPGAFQISGRFPGTPKIVPVAFANFDKPAHEAVFACVIKPPFTMAERGVDVEDADAMRAFLEDYRREFRGHVDEAVELAQTVTDRSADLSGIITNRDSVDVVNEEFELDVRGLELRLSPAGDPNPRTVFYGSSTLRMWHTLAEDLSLPHAVNLGFGGSTIAACDEYFDRLVVPQRPSKLVLYVGENDLFRGATPEEVSERVRRFADVVEAKLPQTSCWFISIKPTPDRDEHLEAVRRTNDLVRAELQTRERWRYVDWFRYMVDDDGHVCAPLYGDDRVHLNRAGYGVLTKVLRDEFSAA